MNLSTYIGSSQAGFWSAAVATLAVVLPSFIIILMITALLKTALRNKYVQAVMGGLKPCVTGIVFATGIYMVLENCVGRMFSINININPRAIIITVLLAASIFSCKKLTGKKLAPTRLILIEAILGAIIYAV